MLTLVKIFLMTIIKVKNASEIKKTTFENIDELAEYIYNLYLEEELPSLTDSEIEEAKSAKAELKANPSAFKRVIRQE